MNNEEINVNRDWGFNINVAGLQAPTGKGGSQLPEGYYVGIVDDMYVNPDKNAGRVIIKIKVAEGPFVGTMRTDGLNIPKSDEDKVRYYWRGLMESAGYGPAELDGGQVTVGRAALHGKKVHFYFVPKEEGNADRQYENITYLSPVEWSQQKQGFEAAGGAAAPTGNGSALGGAAPTGNMLGGVQGGGAPALGGGAPALGGAPAGNTVSQGDVLSKLGLGGQAPAQS